MRKMEVVIEIKLEREYGKMLKFVIYCCFVINDLD